MTPFSYAHNALLMLTKGLYSKSAFVNESLNAEWENIMALFLPTGELLLLGGGSISPHHTSNVRPRIVQGVVD